MSTRRNSRQAARRRATAARRFTPYSLYRRALRIEPLEDRRLLAVVTVNTLSDTTNLNDNLTTLREAIFATNLVVGADTIDFAPALTANGPATIVLTQGELKITDSLTISGPGANLLTIDASGSDPTPGIVNGDGSRVFNIDDGVGTASIVSISSLKLTGGEIAANGGAVFTRESLSLIDMVIDKNFSTSTSSVGAGGGIAAVLNNGAALTISHSLISRNQSTGRGGGISLDIGSSASVLVSHSQIVGNSKWSPGSQATSFAGGGIFISNPFSRGVVTIEDSVVFGNRSDGSGGGISFSGQLTIKNSTIAGNSSLGLGGGIHFQGSTAFSSGLTLADSQISDNSGGNGGGIALTGFGGLSTITRSAISRNTALAHQFGQGGGIYVQQSQVQIVDSTISENIAAHDGGGIFTPSVSMERTTVSNNVAANGGGGLSLPGNGTIRESTITGNSAKTGGAVYAKRMLSPAAAPSLTISHSTITYNEATSNTGGVYVNAGPINLDHSIVARNISPSALDDFLRGVNWPITVVHNLVGDNNGSGLPEAPVGAPDANGNLIGGTIHGVIDPLLGPLADNGGLMFTHALLTGSPAINAGDLSAVAGVNGVPEFDQRGTPFGRVFNGRIDIGAFEYQQASDLNLLVDTLVDENDGNFSRGDLSLREAIALTYMWPSIDTIRFDPALTTNGPAKILLTQGELKITSSMTIAGLGADVLTIDASGNDPTPNSVNGDGSRVFNIDDGVATASIAMISGLTLTGGQTSADGGAIYTEESLTLVDMVIDKNYSTSTSSLGAGGGIAAVLNNGATLTISQSAISNNQSTARGGGISLDVGSASSVLISNSQIVGNSQWLPGSQTTNYGGGGIYVTNFRLGTVTIEDTDVIDNISDGPGGGISAGGPVTINRSTIARNTSLTFGGGIRFGDPNGRPTGLTLTDSQVIDNRGGNGGGIALGFARSVGTITRTTISGNRAERVAIQNGNGGGVYVEQGEIQIVDSTITDNRAENDGGGIFSQWVKIERTTVSDNIAANRGGGLTLTGGGTIRDSTITGNSAKMGGALDARLPTGAVYTGTLLISRSTITNNAATTNAGGIYAVAAGRLTLDHSILAKNTSPSTSDAFFALGSFGHITVTNSLIGDNNGSGLVEAPVGTPDANGNLIGGPVHGLIDPLLGPLADNGGPTFTHALLPGSPAVNAGDPSVLAGLGDVPQFDQRGTPFSRVVGGRIDIGAVEFQPNPLAGDYNYDGTVDVADYVVWRKSGSTLDLRADGNSDGVVDNADYQIWRANFGNTRLGLVMRDTAQPIAMAAASNVDVQAAPNGDSNSARVPAVQVMPSTVATPATKPRLSASRLNAATESKGDGLLAWLADQSPVQMSPHRTATEHIARDRVGDQFAEANSVAEAVDEAFATLLNAAW